MAPVAGDAGAAEGGRDADAGGDAPPAWAPKPPLAWLQDPFGDLPPAAKQKQTVEVIFEVAKVYRPTHRVSTSPFRLRIPKTRLSKEIYDDYVAQPSCTSQRDQQKNAIAVQCWSPDGRVKLRAYQVGDELVVEVEGEGDARPSLPSPSRFKLPVDSSVVFRTQLSTKIQLNPSSGP